MDTFAEILKVAEISVGASIVTSLAAQYVSKRFLDQWLTVRLKDHEAAHSRELAELKATLDHRVNAARAEIETKLRKDTEEYLGDRSAARAYRAEAQKRLYGAVGPLRFQLLVAASDLAQRIDGMGKGRYEFATTLDNYFGQSTIYRILRVFAISELIERQIAYADFAVDPDMLSLRHFKRQAFRSLSSSTVSQGHPQEFWEEQEHHVYYDILQVISSALIVHDAKDSPSRVMHFDEFSAKVAHNGFKSGLHPIPQLMQDFTISSKPIVWLRLLALAHLCASLVQAYGAHLGLDNAPIDIDDMLARTKDDYICQHRAKYRDMITGFEVRSAAAAG